MSMWLSEVHSVHKFAVKKEKEAPEKAPLWQASIRYEVTREAAHMARSLAMLLRNRSRAVS